ncbi:hypothetical protein MTR_6g051380 [Medicago truncatula]|uniref:Uncharacterized protein n=1 Tax=Medicago truncatula TaxID=3880 RepID=G7KKZ8_MEDTR|nr:hypothetical protein MTR_6g051380 [Medicago truncatula]
MGGGHLGKKSYQSQASSSSSMFNGDVRVLECCKDKNDMEKVQSMLKAKESGNDEVWRTWLMESELRQKLLEAFVTYPPRKLEFHRDFASEEVLELVGWFYNIEMLTDDEEINMLNP